MSLEKKILATCLQSREAFSKIDEDLEGKIAIPFSEFLLDACRSYYARDGNAKLVDIDWLRGHIDNVFDNPKKADEYKEFTNEIIQLDVSADNIVDLILSSKKKEIGHRLAAALANDDKTVDELMEQYNGLKDKTVKETEEVFHSVSIQESVDTVLNKDNLIKLPTRFLNESTDGGCSEGHHIVVYARPETGKTALCTSIAWAFSDQGLPGIYFGNEDPMGQIIVRGQSCFTGLSRDALRANPALAQQRLEASGWGLVRFIPMSPGSLGFMEKYIKRYKPKWIIVDQLRNLNVRSDTRVNQLEAAATGIRNLANRYSLVAVSVTQAGDSADQKLVLGMGDIDFSNTGIPAQADLMIGMGVNDAYEQQNMRMLALPKNKLSGKHSHGPVRINPQLSRIEDA